MRSPLPRAVTGAACVAAVTAAALSLGAAPASATPSPSYSIAGIDISRYQHPNGAAVDWAKVTGSGVRFVIVGATDGASSGIVNPYFKADFAAAQNAGLVRGAYHFAEPALDANGSATTEAVREADNAVGAIGAAALNDAGTMPLILDLEERDGMTDAQLATWTRAFSDEVKALAGRAPVVYTSACFFSTGCTGLPSTLGDLVQWTAAYTSSPAPSTKNWTMWQWSSSSTVPGISGNVDADVFNGTTTDLAHLSEGQTPAIVALWNAQGGAGGPLGALVGKESQIAAGVWEQDYANGSVVWSQATGAVPVTGTLRDYWRTHPTGLPTSPQTTVTGGTVQEFQAMDVSVSAAGTVQTFTGTVRDAWRVARTDVAHGGDLGIATGALTAAGAYQQQQFALGTVTTNGTATGIAWLVDLTQHPVADGQTAVVGGRRAGAKGKAPAPQVLPQHGSVIVGGSDGAPSGQTVGAASGGAPTGRLAS